MAEYTPDFPSHTPTAEQLLAQLQGGAPVEPLNRDRLCPPTAAECEQRDINRATGEAEFRAAFTAETIRRQQAKDAQAIRLAGTVISLAEWRQRKAHQQAAESATLPYSQQR